MSDNDSEENNTDETNYSDECKVEFNGDNKIVNNAVKRFTGEISDIKNLLNNLIRKHDIKTMAGPQSYAQVVNKPVVIIKPKDKQRCEQTRREICDNIKPSEIAVGVTSVKNVKIVKMLKN
ncbi:hypothetical protein CBL_10600 [Carabus blaptoides fortunei]